MNEIIGFMALLIGAIYDLRTRKLPLLFLYIFLVVSFVIAIMGNEKSVMDIVAGIIPGIIIIIFSLNTDGVIGKGDGLILLSLGLIFGIRVTVLILFIAVIIAAFVAVILILILKKSRKTTLPFVPFLLMGQLITIFI